MADDPVIVLLAAGRATRMRGAEKLLEPVNDMPLIRLMAGRAAKAGITRVVLAADQPDRRAALDGLETDVIEVAAGGGMAASIVAGVNGLRGPVLLALADMPGVTASDLHLMIGLSRQAPKAILRAASKDGQPGHPVLFPADLVPHLTRLTGDQGARDVLRAHARRVHLIPLADDRALVDLDTPEDWAAWRARHR
jgi:CTP:molybdopterin cytidylyltransferase MocA